MAKWIWPCPRNNTITSGVGPRWGTTHKGIDIAAPKGANIVSTRSGVVIAKNTSCTHNYGKESSCGCGGGYGNYVYVDHLDGYVSRYAHMTDVNVNIGDRVSQGHLLGTVGSTGYSTGNHLHFEIRDGNNYKDPELYVNPKNTIINSVSANEPANIQLDDTGTIVSSSPSSSTDATSTGTSNSAPSESISSGSSASGALTPVMTRDFIHGKPYHSYLQITIGEGDSRLVLREYHGKPSIIQRFEINKLDVAGSTATIVIFDDHWNNIEEKLADNWDKIYMQYGYSDGKLSPEYKMLLQDYSIDFNDTGVILSISTISEGIYENLDEYIKINTNTKNPAGAIRKICTEMGWTIDEEDFIETDDVDRDDYYFINGTNPVKYILEVIVPEINTGEEESVYFFQDADEHNTSHLKLVKYREEETSSSIPTYIYQKGYDSVVESISFDINGIFGAGSPFHTVTGITGSNYDALTKEESSYSKINAAFAKVNTASEFEALAATYFSDSPHTNPNQSRVKYVASGETSSQMSSRISYTINNSLKEKYTATMNILGDPSIKLFDKLRVLNPTEYNSLHHTSGIYLVTGIVDSIENGDYKTTLKLQRTYDNLIGTNVNDGMEVSELDILTPYAIRMMSNGGS